MNDAGPVFHRDVERRRYLSVSGDMLVCAFAPRSDFYPHLSFNPEHGLDCWVWSETFPEHVVHTTAGSPQEAVELVLLRERVPSRDAQVIEVWEVT